ncbi:MAG: M4 family metallopeptidase, partial [Sphingobacteriaceae bacterium]
NDLLYKNHTQSIAGVTGKDPEGPFNEFNTATIDAQGFGDFRNINDTNFGVAQKVHLGLESAATYFASNYSRMGYDGASGPIHAYVYSYKIGGAFYDREESLFFPYDDGLYQSEIKVQPELQTVYHEYAHAFTVSESGLIGGSTESGMLNEALSDIWSYTVADYYLKKHPTDDVDPSIYNSLFGNTWITTSGNQEFQDWYKSQKGYSVNRISKDPNSDNHPDFYNGQYWDPLNKDPHFNSTVISYWYYLLSVGGNVNPENDPGTTISIAGIGVEKAAKIIYLVTTNLLNANTKYEGFALRTTLAAKLIFGEDSPELNSTLAAWAAVGLGDLNFGSPVGCIPPADYNPKMFIQSFELANVKTDKPNDFIGGYRDYSFLNIEGKSNYSYDFKIKSFSKPYVPNLYWSVWIDIDGNSTFDANEKIASGWPSAPATITLPTLLKGPKSIMRIVLSADQNASPCFNPLNDKEPKYMEDYGITIEEYCPIVKWTNPDFTNAHPKFNGLIFNNITLTACGGTEVFNENPASQQILLDETSKTIIGGKDYSLTFNFKPSGDSEVHLNPKGTDKPNTFLTDCITQPPYGFSLGDFDDDPNKDESGSGGSSDLTAKCSSVSEDIFEFTVCPQRFRRMVWIDFNRNGQFEKNEQYETLFDATSKTFYVNFTIPNWVTTLKGKTRIRIYAYLGNGALFGGNACGDGINGMPEKIFKGEPVISKTAIDIDINLDKQIYQLDMKAAPDQPADQVEMQPVSLSLYPNPASNLVDLSIKGTTTDNFTLELYDSSGNRLLVKQPWDGRSLDISRYPDGLYLITLKRDREVYTQKLLIQR